MPVSPRLSTNDLSTSTFALGDSTPVPFLGVTAGSTEVGVRILLAVACASASASASRSGFRLGTKDASTPSVEATGIEVPCVAAASAAN